MLLWNIIQCFCNGCLAFEKFKITRFCTLMHMCLKNSHDFFEKFKIKSFAIGFGVWNQNLIVQFCQLEIMKTVDSWNFNRQKIDLAYWVIADKLKQTDLQLGIVTIPMRLLWCLNNENLKNNWFDIGDFRRKLCKIFNY